MDLWPQKSGLWSYITGWSLSSCWIYKKNYWCIQIVVLNERWSLSSGGLRDRFYCMCKSRNCFTGRLFVTSSCQLFPFWESLLYAVSETVQSRSRKSLMANKSTFSLFQVTFLLLELYNLQTYIHWDKIDYEH